jgi:hypothetical protein
MVAEAVIGLSAGVLLAFSLAGCTTASEPRPVVQLGGPVTGGGYGDSAQAVMEHPALRADVQALFARDWEQPGTAAGPSRPAPQFFARGAQPRTVRVDGQEYVGVVGCAAPGCETGQGLLLVSADRTRFLARLDEGGFSHYYVRGPGLQPGAPVDEATRALLDAAWRATRARG